MSDDQPDQGDETAVVLAAFGGPDTTIEDCFEHMANEMRIVYLCEEMCGERLLELPSLQDIQEALDGLVEAFRDAVGNMRYDGTLDEVQALLHISIEIRLMAAAHFGRLVAGGQLPHPNQVIPE